MINKVAVFTMVLQLIGCSQNSQTVPSKDSTSEERPSSETDTIIEAEKKDTASSHASSDAQGDTPTSPKVSDVSDTDHEKTDTSAIPTETEKETEAAGSDAPTDADTTPLDTIDTEIPVDTGIEETEPDSQDTENANAPRHDICLDIGSDFGMGAAIYGDDGTDWYLNAAKPPSSINWLTGYIYASGDPDENPDGFEWLINYRMDTAEQGGAPLPMITFYRMLNEGEAHGYTGTEIEIVQQMLTDGDAVRDYLDDFISLLEQVETRDLPILIHVEPDSWGFMIWAFKGVPGSGGAGDAEQIPVDLSGANHPALTGQSFPDTTGGLGRAMLYLRDKHAPSARMGWHASNFQVGTHPEAVTRFYSTMGSWDVIVTEPPHMISNGAEAWDMTETQNQANADWFETVSRETGLPIIIWQTYVNDGNPYLGGWPKMQSNLAMFAKHGVVAVLWDANSKCGYTCSPANDLLGYLEQYAAAPLPLPAGSICF